MGGILSTIACRAAAGKGRPAWIYLPEVIAIVIAASAVPLVAGWVPPNLFYGFRTPATMASPGEWLVANRLMGGYMIASQAVAIGTVSTVSSAMMARHGGDRVLWGVLWSCLTVLIGVGAAVAHYYSRG